MKCHSRPETGNQWGVWKDSGHAKAFEVLASDEAKGIMSRLSLEGDAQKADSCLECHAPMKDKREQGVSCEVCHGRDTGYGGAPDCSMCASGYYSLGNASNFTCEPYSALGSTCGVPPSGSRCRR